MPPVGLLMEPNKLNLNVTVELMIQRRRSPLGRFLPRLGPFVPRTAYFSAHQSEPATGLAATRETPSSSIWVMQLCKKCI